MRRLALVLAAGLAACGSDDDGADADAGDDAPDADLGPDSMWDPQVDPEIDGQVRINEIMADNAATLFDEDEHAGDWIELYNPTETDIPLRNYGLTDALGNPTKDDLPNDLMLPAGARLIVWLDGNPEAGPDHSSITLAKEGGVVGFARPDGSYIDRVSYGVQATDFSVARTPDGSDEWQFLWHVSPGEANPDGAGAPAPVEDEEEDPEEAPAAPDDLSDFILGDDAFPAFELLVAEADVTAFVDEDCDAAPSSHTWREAMLVFDGREYGPVGLRCKGQNSFQPFEVKPSLRINVDEFIPGAKFFALDDLTLNNMSNDPSMIHERLAYWVAREAGLPASRANHATLEINGEPYGLYANVETVKWQMVAGHFADPMGPLFEATDVDFADEYIAGYELESGADDRSLLQGAANALETADADAAMAAVATYVDVDAFVRFWAVMAVIAQLDSWPYSLPGDDVFVYADPTSDKLYLIPWGMDETFFVPDFDPGTLEDARIAIKCKASATCYQAYVDEAWAMLDFVEEDLDWDAERAAIIAQVDEAVDADTHKDLFLPDSAFCTAQSQPDPDLCVGVAQGGVGYFMATRRDRWEEWLPAPTP